MHEIWIEIIDFNDKYFPGWRDEHEIYYSNALAGEVGELCNMVKHRAGGGTNKSTPDDYELIEECADVFIYLSLLIGSKRVSSLEFEHIIRDKMAINVQRMNAHSMQKGESK